MYLFQSYFLRSLQGLWEIAACVTDSRIRIVGIGKAAKLLFPPPVAGLGS